MFRFGRNQLPAPRFTQGVWMLLVVIFASLSMARPVLGLAGLGTILILSAVLIEANRQLIWQGYRSRYKQSKGKGRWSEPRPLYYRLNVYVVWPLVFLLGVGSLIGAYLAG